MTMYAEFGTVDAPTASMRMADLVQTFDWASTPLGERERWPQSLRTIVDMMLSAGHAMCLMWGPERTFLYNDRYAEILGRRHPHALGMPIQDVWPDVWADIEPLVTRTFAGETMRFENTPLLMTRHGYDEETWWTFAYSPVRDETGAVAGLLNITNETMDGLKLARAVRDRWPPVTIMVTSGRVKVTKEEMPENGLFFEKPYPPDGIIKTLNDIAAQIQS